MAKHVIAKVGELPEGGGKLIFADKIEVGLFLIEGEYRAYRNMCPHAGAPVCNAALDRVLSSEQITIPGRERPTIRCPWHGWEFDLGTGCHTFSHAKLRNYEIEIEGEDIVVVLPDPPPPMPAAPPVPVSADPHPIAEAAAVEEPMADAETGL